MSSTVESAPPDATTPPVIVTKKSAPKKKIDSPIACKMWSIIDILRKNEEKNSELCMILSETVLSELKNSIEEKNLNEIAEYVKGYTTTMSLCKSADRNIDILFKLKSSFNCKLPEITDFQIRQKFASD